MKWPRNRKYFLFSSILERSVVIRSKIQLIRRNYFRRFVIAWMFSMRMIVSKGTEAANKRRMKLQTRFNHRVKKRQKPSNAHYTRSRKWQIKLFLLYFCGDFLSFPPLIGKVRAMKLCVSDFFQYYYFYFLREMNLSWKKFKRII